MADTRRFVAAWKLSVIWLLMVFTIAFFASQDAFDVRTGRILFSMMTLQFLISLASSIRMTRLDDSAYLGRDK
jgi:hypothetical protein